MKSQPPRKNCQFLLIFMLVSDEEQTVWKCDWTKELDQTAVPWEENASRLSVEQALPSPNWKSSRGEAQRERPAQVSVLTSTETDSFVSGACLGEGSSDFWTCLWEGKAELSSCLRPSWFPPGQSTQCAKVSYFKVLLFECQQYVMFSMQNWCVVLSNHF